VPVLLAIAGLLLLVLIHEAGHFIAAKSVGMRATKFYVGFPPAVAKLRRGDTEYGLGAIPLGGYVRITGMARPRVSDLRSVSDAVAEAARNRPPDEPDRLTPAFSRVERALAADDRASLAPAMAELQAAVEADRQLIDSERLAWCERELTRTGEDVDPRSYWRQPVWKRIVVIAAGPFANLAAAVVILTGFFASGVPIFQPTTKVDVVGYSSPAQKMGLEHGDQLLAVNGTPIRPCPAVPTAASKKQSCGSEQVRAGIQRKTGPGVTLLVRRNGKELTLGPAHPTLASDGNRYLGFVFALERTGTQRYGLLAAPEQAIDDISYITRATFSAIGDRFTQGNTKGLSTPVGIVDQSSTTISQGVYPRLLAWISLSLAIFNMLPFLPLDGGHILFALIELVRRRPVRREVYERVSAIGIACMLMLFFVGLSNDVGTIVNGPSVTP
jgi:regulator of sigma E protease